MTTYKNSRDAAKAVVAMIRQSGVEIDPRFLPEYERQIERAIVRAWVGQQVSQKIGQGPSHTFGEIGRYFQSITMEAFANVTRG